MTKNWKFDIFRGNFPNPYPNQKLLTWPDSSNKNLTRCDPGQKILTRTHLYNNVLFCHILVKLILRYVHTWSFIPIPFYVKIAFLRSIIYSQLADCPHWSQIWSKYLLTKSSDSFLYWESCHWVFTRLLIFHSHNPDHSTTLLQYWCEDLW